jgi:hypothetical protein
MVFSGTVASFDRMSAPTRPSGRTQIARVRAHRVKVGFGLTAVLAFGTAMLYARLSSAGHSKHPATSLSAPSRFRGIVRANRLLAGAIAPPQAPPQVVTATSWGGNRQANAALFRIVLVRMRYEPTKDYVDRRTSEGKSKREIIRCLKRYVAREVYTALKQRSETNLARAA